MPLTQERKIGSYQRLTMKQSVIYLTLSIEGTLDERRRDSIEAFTRTLGGTASWRTSETLRQTYALLELPEQQYDAERIAAAAGATLYEKPIIALALSPTVSEALPPLLEALSGSGRPAGVKACFERAGAAIVEWDPAITDPSVIFALVDVELARFRSGRAAELLSPLPPSLIATVAATGLQAPQIRPERILELRVDRA